MPAYAGPPVTARPGEVASTLRLLGYLALGIALIILDHRGGWLSQARARADLAAQPLWWVAGLPGRLTTRMQDDAASHARLTGENRALRNELLIANARLTRLRTAALDNAQLRALLGVAEGRGLDVQLAPILNIDLDPTRQRLVLAAGSSDGVHVGQPVIDAGGLMGQIIQTTPSSATVLLLTDPDHAVPVVVSRNGVRLIVYGRSGRLELSDVPLNTDVKVGDVILTSGLGGRFPAGFPVGTVTALRPDDSRAFLVGELKPAAQLDRGRDVLLLKDRTWEAGAETWATPAAAVGGPAQTQAVPPPPGPAPNPAGGAVPASATPAAPAATGVDAPAATPAATPPVPPSQEPRP